MFAYIIFVENWNYDVYDEKLQAGALRHPTNDFAFKRILGTEQYKDATIGLGVGELSGKVVMFVP